MRGFGGEIRARTAATPSKSWDLRLVPKIVDEILFFKGELIGHDGGSSTNRTHQTPNPMGEAWYYGFRFAGAGNSPPFAGYLKMPNKVVRDEDEQNHLEVEKMIEGNCLLP